MPTPKQDEQTRAKMRAHAVESDRRWTDPRYREMFRRDYNKAADFANAPMDKDPDRIPIANVGSGDMVDFAAKPYYGDSVGYLSEIFDHTANRRHDVAAADAGEYARAHAGLTRGAGETPRQRRDDERNQGGYPWGYPMHELTDYEMSQIPPAQRQSGWGTPAPEQGEISAAAARFLAALKLGR